jgi:hypothetical protein
MKVIAFEEHHKIPAEANKAIPIEQIHETWQKLDSPATQRKVFPPGYLRHRPARLRLPGTNSRYVAQRRESIELKRATCL